MNGRRHAGAVETPFPRETGVADRRVPIIVLGCITLIWGYLWIPGKLGVTAGAVVAKILRRRHQVDVLSLTTWQGLFGSLPLVVLAAVFPGDGIHWTTAFIWSLAYSILIGTALGALLWLYVLNLVPAHVAGMALVVVALALLVARRFRIPGSPQQAR